MPALVGSFFLLVLTLVTQKPLLILMSELYQSMPKQRR